MYKKGAIVILEAKGEDFPVFALVQYVLAVDVENYSFIVHILHTTCFNPHSHAYEVEYPSLNEFSVVKLADLVDHRPIGLYTCMF